MTKSAGLESRVCLGPSNPAPRTPAVLSAQDEVKFVVAGRGDYEWARDVIRERGLDERVRRGELRALLMSPVWDAVDLEALAAWILEDHLPVRFQLQLHKLIWGADTTGV
jgi:7-carboxy-7-deazaguanine synthase